MLISEECRDRFWASRNLYAQSDGEESTNKKGARLLKCHDVLLETTLSKELVQALSHAIGEIAGVRMILIEGRKVRILFDRLAAVAEQTEQAIVGMGIQLDGTQKKRQRALLHYTKECEKANIDVFEKVYAHYLP